MNTNNQTNINTNKHYCIVSALYEPHTGGIETYTKRLANMLIKWNNKVTILTSKLYYKGEEEIITTQNLNIVKLDSYKLLNGRFPIYKNSKRNKSILEDLKKQDISYFIINTRFYPICIEAARLANKMNIKPILIDHGSAHLTLGNKLFDIAVENVEHTFSKKIKRFNISYYGISQASVNWLKHFNINALGTLPNSINADEFVNNASKRNIRKEFSIPEKAFVVMFIGRYTKEKGIIQLLSAAKHLKEQSDIHFILCGKGKYKSKISSLVNSTNIHDVGTVEQSDVAAIMLQSDIMCLPSRSEGFCTSLLEASSCKLPSVITDVGGAREIIKNNNYGYILNTDTANEIIQVIKKLKNKQSQLNKIGENSYNIVKNEYNWEKTTNKIIEACKTNNETTKINKK